MVRASFPDPLFAHPQPPRSAPRVTFPSSVTHVHAHCGRSRGQAARLVRFQPHGAVTLGALGRLDSARVQRFRIFESPRQIQMLQLSDPPRAQSPPQRNTSALTCLPEIGNTLNGNRQGNQSNVSEPTARKTIRSVPALAWATDKLYGAPASAPVILPCFPTHKQRAVIFNPARGACRRRNTGRWIEI